MDRDHRYGGCRNAIFENRDNAGPEAKKTLISWAIRTVRFAERRKSFNIKISCVGFSPTCVVGKDRWLCSLPFFCLLQGSSLLIARETFTAAPCQRYQVLVGASDGELGLLNTLEVSSRVDNCAAAVIGTRHTLSPVSPRPQHPDGPVIIEPGPAAPSVDPSFRDGRNGEAIVRGFSRAMDSFQDSLRTKGHHADASLGSSKTDRIASEASSEISASISSKDIRFEGGFLYRPVVRGLGVNASGHSLHGENRRWAMTSLSVSARKPLLAGIVKAMTGSEDSHHDKEGTVCDEDGSNNGSTGMAVDVRGSTTLRSLPSISSEVQVWNYRTKRLLVRHRFEQGPASREDLGGLAGGGESEVCIGGGGTGGPGGEGHSLEPVAISLHPTGDEVAVAFPHYLNIFYVVGAGGSDEDVPLDHSDASSSCSLSSGPSISPSRVTLDTNSSTTRASPLAALRSDQREFLTKGIFSVPGEEGAIVNYDPVSAIEYAPGGHLLAVVTGKVESDPEASRCIRRFPHMPLWPSCRSLRCTYPFVHTFSEFEGPRATRESLRLPFVVGVQGVSKDVGAARLARLARPLFARVPSLVPSTETQGTLSSRLVYQRVSDRARPSRARFPPVRAQRSHVKDKGLRALIVVATHPHRTPKLSSKCEPPAGAEPLRGLAEPEWDYYSSGHVTCLAL